MTRGITESRRGPRPAPGQKRRGQPGGPARGGGSRLAAGNHGPSILLRPEPVPENHRSDEASPATIDVPGVLRRGLAVAGLTGIALVHVVDAPGKFRETPYLGWGYLLLVAGCMLVAIRLTNDAGRRAWCASAGLASGAIAVYGLSRTTGLPAASGDVGNWFEPLGLAALFLETVVLAIAGRSLVAGRADGPDTPKAPAPRGPDTSRGRQT